MYDLDDCFHEPIENSQDGLTLGWWTHGQSDSKDQGHTHYLQHGTVAGSSSKKILRHHVGQKVKWAPLVHLRGGGLATLHILLMGGFQFSARFTGEALSRLHGVDPQQAQSHGKSGGAQVECDGLASHAAEFSHIGQGGHP